MSRAKELISRHRIISDQVEDDELAVILEYLERALSRGVHGHVLEFGCFVGTTSLFLSRLLAGDISRQLHVYDSFQGLPEKSRPDMSPIGEQFKKGELKATRKQLISNFRRAGLTMPVIHSGWFSEISEAEVPSPIAFAFLDGDYYTSISECLHLIETKLSPGAVIIVDDYQSEALPGVQKAVDEWLLNQNYGLKITRSLAVITTD